MKKIFLLALLCLTGYGGFAQNPNNHWILGTSDVNFATNPPVLSTVSNAGKYGDAVYSDDNGNLLFYTDGVNVYDKNHAIMYGGANIGWEQSTTALRQVQPAVIIPYPGNAQKFYVITSETDIYITGTDCGNAPAISYWYTIVDFGDAAYPLGKTSYSNYLGSYSDYTLRPMTVIPKADGLGYFLILQNTNMIKTYEITTTGLNFAPVSSYTLPSTVPFSYASICGEFRNDSHGTMKFAPNGTTFGELIEYNGHHSSGETKYSKFFTLTFNPATGAFSNFTMIEDNPYTVGASVDFEFSADSQKAYLLRNNVYVKDLTSPTTASRLLSETGSSSTPSGFNHISRDKNGNILIASDGNTAIKKIDNQNSFSASTVSTTFFSINAGFASNHVFPQLISNLTGACPATLSVTAAVATGTDSKQASGTITASNAISSGAVGIYHAGTSVVLTSGFHAANGTRFRAYIEGCSGTYVGRMAQQDEPEMALETENPKAGTALYVSLYPNPSGGALNIGTKGLKMVSITLSNMADSRTVAQYKVRETESFDTDISHLKQGLYLVTVQTSDGQTLTGKVIRK